MSANPLYVGSTRTPTASVTAANTNRDGSGTIVDLVVPGPNGSRVDAVQIQAYGTVTAGVIRLFLYNPDTAVWRLISETLVTATTPSTSLAAFSSTITFFGANGPLTIPKNWKLGVSTHNAENFYAMALVGDY